MELSFLTGTGVALVTPFQQVRVDYESLKRIVEYTIKGGVDYLVVLGSTGEAATISKREKQTILDVVVETSQARVPIVFGCFGGNNTAEITKSFGKYHMEGVSALLSSSPEYNRPSQRGIKEHFTKLADKSPLPIILYNVPSRTASDMAAETIIQLSKHEQIVGVKEASADFFKAAQVLKDADKDFLVLSGDDITALPLLSLGAKGVISVIANAFPKTFSGMVDAALKQDFKKARELHLKMLEFHPLLYREGNPSGIKSLMALKGFCSQDMRLPLVPITDGLQENLAKLLEKLPLK